MIFIFPSLMMLPLVAFYFSVTSSVGHLSVPFSPGPLSIWSIWLSLRISPPSPVATTSPFVLTVAVAPPKSVEPPGAPTPPPETANYSPSMPPIVVQSATVSHQRRYDINPWVVLPQSSSYHAQLALASEMLVKLMEANFERIGPSHQSPPSISARPHLIEASAPPPPPPSPTEPVPATRTQSPTSLTDVRRSIPLSFITPRAKQQVQIYPPSKLVKSAASTRMSWSDYMQVKGCFLSDPRACPKKSILDELLDSFVEPSAVVLVFIMAGVCAIGISLGITQHSSESIGIPPIIPHTPAISEDCLASQQVLDASSSEQERVFIPSCHPVTFCDVAVQTDDSTLTGTPTKPDVIEQVDPSSDDASPAIQDDSFPVADEAQLLDAVPEMEIEHPAGPPAIVITPSNSGIGDFSMALNAALDALHECREYRDYSLLSPLYRSPQSTAPPSPVPSQPPSLVLPHWTENVIYNPDYLRTYKLGPDGLRPSLSEREGLYGLLQGGDSHGIRPSTSTALEAHTPPSNRFGEDALTSFVFRFSSQVDRCESRLPEDHGATSSMGSSSSTSSCPFEFWRPGKRRKVHHEDGGTTICASAGFSGIEDETLDSTEDDSEISMELTSVLDDVLDDPSAASSGSPSCESEPVVVPNILIIVSSPPTTPTQSHSEEFDLTGFEDDIPMSSTPIKSRPSLDTFRDLCMSSIHFHSSDLRASPSLDGHCGIPGSPSCSTSLFDLARHLPPLTSSERSDYSRSRYVLAIPGSGQEGNFRTSESELLEPSQTNGQRFLESQSSSYSDAHTFDMEAYRHPPPLPMDDSFFLQSAQSSVSSSVHERRHSVISESNSNSVELVAGEHGEVLEETPMEHDSSFHIEDGSVPNEYLLDQTFEAELAGSDSFGFDSLDEVEAASLPPLPDAGSIQQYIPSSASSTSPIPGFASVDDELPSLPSPSPPTILPMPLTNYLPPFVLPPLKFEKVFCTGSVHLLPSESMQDEAAVSTQPTQAVCDSQTSTDHSLACNPSSPVFARDATLEPTFDTPSLASRPTFSFSTPASVAYHRSFERLQAVFGAPRGIATASPLRECSTPPTGNVKLSPSAVVRESTRSNVFARDSTPELSLDVSSVASPASGLSTPASVANARSFQRKQAVLGPSLGTDTPSPLRECSNISYQTPSRIPIRCAPTSKRSAYTAPSQRPSERTQAQRKVVPLAEYNPYKMPR